MPSTILLELESWSSNKTPWYLIHYSISLYASRTGDFLKSLHQICTFSFLPQLGHVFAWTHVHVLHLFCYFFIWLLFANKCNTTQVSAAESNSICERSFVYLTRPIQCFCDSCKHFYSSFVLRHMRLSFTWLFQINSSHYFRMLYYDSACVILHL